MIGVSSSFGAFHGGVFSLKEKKAPRIRARRRDVLAVAWCRRSVERGHDALGAELGDDAIDLGIGCDVSVTVMQPGQ
jgi:hypothetical protein